MYDTLTRLVQPLSDWHIIHLTPDTLDQLTAKQTADLLICDHLSAHCADMKSLLAHWLPVLKPDGWLAVLDTVVPGSRLRGKKANLQRRAGKYVNRLLRLGDGRNGRNLSLDEWLEVLRVVNVSKIRHETQKQAIELDTWLNTYVTSIDRTRFRVILKQTPEPVTAFLTPQAANDRITFFLTELTLIGRIETHKE